MLVFQSDYTNLYSHQKPNILGPMFPSTLDISWHSSLSLLFNFLTKFIYLAVLCLSCSIWDLVPWPGTEPRLHALVAHGLKHWTTAKSLPLSCFLSIIYSLTLPWIQNSNSERSWFTFLWPLKTVNLSS